MRIVKIALPLVVAVGLVAASIIGCSERKAAQPVACMGRAAGPPGAPKAHGGTANVNDAAYDAMFFRNYGVNPYVDTDDDALSTFAVDVDTGSYTLARSYLNRGHLPPKDAVRVEEFVNYFRYDDDAPENGDAFAIHLAAAPSPFAENRTLLRVGLKAREIDAADRKPAVLTFVIDVSGSMGREDRLGLVKRSLRLLVERMREGDRVGIAVYESHGREVLSHREVGGREEIIAAIEELRPAGSTYAEEGLRIGYGMAARAFRKGAINRVILCSDGVANVGRTGPEAILRQVRDHAGRGITLSAVGFGMGNYNDVLMEQLADKGDGHYAYVDTLDEARRVFVENLTGTLQVVARDVKVQVEFDPNVVRSYRLLGYENRDVADEDFRDDTVDGGEIGAGHAVTALYELKLWPEKAGRLAAVRVRYKRPEGGKSAEVSRTIATADAAGAFDAAGRQLKLAACVAQFAEVLRKSYWARGQTLEPVLAVAEGCRNDYDYRADVKELVSLIGRARKLRVDAADGAELGSLEQ
jgi:Ca-activated chloride channel family protein